MPLFCLQLVFVFPFVAVTAARPETLFGLLSLQHRAGPWPPLTAVRLLVTAASFHVHLWCSLVQAYDKIGRAALLKIGAAVQAAGEQLPEAASGREPSAAAAFAAARTGDLACLAVKQGLLLLGDSTLRRPALVRRFSSSVACASQRVSDLLHRRYGGVSPPELISLFIAVRGHVHHQLSERWLFLEA